MLFVAAFWRLDPFTAEVVHGLRLDRTSRRSRGADVYRTIALRTVAIAAAVTVTDALLAFPIAFYMARSRRRGRAALLVVAVLMPLWASYLVKVYAWRIDPQEDGILNWALAAVRAARARASATSPPGSSSPTSGCRS